jgi:hypothetical protein
MKFQHLLIFLFFGGFFEIINILEVEIGINGPGIVGVNHFTINFVHSLPYMVLWNLSVISKLIPKGTATLALALECHCNC